MKIGLAAEHAGLIDLLCNIWCDHHDVRLHPQWAGSKLPDWQGDEDIIVSTLPYRIESLKTGKATICYFTDPTWPKEREEVQKLLKEKKITVIGAEDCYLPEHFVEGVTEFIPFALNPDNYPVYQGDVPVVAIANRKPIERWEAVVRGAKGLFIDIASFLKVFAWVIIKEDYHWKYKQKLAQSRVLFYYSHSPFTIVMFEAMTIGIPIVAFDHTHAAKNNVMHKYLFNCSTDQKQINEWLSDYLAKPPTRVEYPALPNFMEVRAMWDDLFNRFMAH